MWQKASDLPGKVRRSLCWELSIKNERCKKGVVIWSPSRTEWKLEWRANWQFVCACHIIEGYPNGHNNFDCPSFQRPIWLLTMHCAWPSTPPRHGTFRMKSTNQPLVHHWTHTKHTQMNSSKHFITICDSQVIRPTSLALQVLGNRSAERRMRLARQRFSSEGLELG